jgi:hypothetical protein
MSGKNRGYPIPEMIQGKMLKLFHVAILFPPQIKMLQSKHFLEKMLRVLEDWNFHLFTNLLFNCRIICRSRGEE